MADEEKEAKGEPVMDLPTTPPDALLEPGKIPTSITHAPLLRAPEKVRTIFLVTMATACLPLAAGIAFFGWRAAWVAALSITSCAVIERFYFHVTHTPSMLGRSHAYLTGLLLALTLPPFTPWYVVIIAAAFAIIIGKAIFGGVGHFLWQPALVGRFAVAVLMPVLVAPPAVSSLQPDDWPILARGNLVFGDIKNAQHVDRYKGWKIQDQPAKADAFDLPNPARTLARLTNPKDAPAFSALARVRDDISNRKPTALTQLPPLSDMLFGCRPGAIGETCSVVIIIAGMYLIYRNYVKWQLPVSFLVSAALVAAIAPIQLAGPSDTAEWVSMPLLYDGLDVPATLGVGFTYVNYQILSGGMLLAAFFLATEMTSCPVTTGGQVIFGTGCGVLAMLIKLYLDTPIPAFVAVLIMNTFAPSIDAFWLPRVFGQRHFAWLRRKS